MLLKLIQEKDETFTTAEWTCLGLSPVLGVFVTRLILLILVKSAKVSFCHGICVVFKFWSSSDIEQMLAENHLKRSQDAVQNIELAAINDGEEERPLLSGNSEESSIM